MTSTPKVLLVEDTASLAATYQVYVSDLPIQLLVAEDGETAKSLIDSERPDILLLDLVLPDISGQDILQWMKEIDIDTDVIVMTAHSTVEVAVEVMQSGAQDFLEKPFDKTRLRTTLNNALEKRRLRNYVSTIKETFERNSYHGFIGASLPMQAVYRIIDAAAPSTATVFITGESGTGKEVCAEAIHRAGNRAEKPFIAINCGAIPHDLMESEIFGHTKGAFTGATSDRKGAAALADGGTLFLDEIGEMDMDLQTKLLRFVQTGRFQKVGGSQEEQVNVRFICATNRDPLKEVEAGRFREDLYYRLHVVPISLPTLRERSDDIMLIANHFLVKYATEEGKQFREFTPEAEVVFRHYSWPGNVRQLQNVIRNIVVLHNGEKVELAQLPPPLDTSLSQQEIEGITPQMATAQTASVLSSGGIVIDRVRPLALVEREVIEHAINHCDGNIPKAAAMLEVSPSTIYRKKQAWDEQESVA